MLRRVQRLAGGALGAALLFSCGEGGGGPAPGTNEWFWDAAGDTFAASDFDKTQEHLGKIDGERELAAAIWRSAVLGGLGRGYLELSDAYAAGAESAKSDVSAFNNNVQEYRRQGRRHMIELGEYLGRIKSAIGEAQEVPFDFSFPIGNHVASPIAATVSAGTPPSAGDQVELASHTLKRGILLEVTEIVGAGEDVAQARAMFETPPLSIGTDEYLVALARSLVHNSKLFGQERLNEPKIRDFLLHNANKLLEGPLASEEEELKGAAEEIVKEIEKATKK